MPTHPHSNPSEGYALRIGKYLPSEAANLAYIHTDTPEPEKNLLVMDIANEIPENREKDMQFLSNLHTQETTVPGKDGPIPGTFLFQDGKPYLAEQEHIYVTSQYTMDTEKNPLYYVSATRLPVDTRNLFARPYINGQRVGQPVLLNKKEEHDLYVYEGSQIKVSAVGEFGLKDTEFVKMLLIPGEQTLLYVLSNFVGNKDRSYQVTYPSIVQNKKSNATEVLNPTPIFSRSESGITISDTQHFLGGEYDLIQQANGDGYYVALANGAETEAGEHKVLNYNTRIPHDFSYQIVCDTEARFSQRNPVTLNIGLLYINENIHSAVPLTSSLKKLVYKNPYLPDYLSFQNPHRQSGENLKETTNYWLATLQMPKEHYLDYDILVISGYGSKDFTPYSENIRAFLDAGGTLLVDNNGVGTSVLDFKESGRQTFVADISFSTSEVESGSLKYGIDNKNFSQRYYPKENIQTVGVTSPVLQFLNQESRTDWEALLVHESGGMALTQKKTGSIGRLLVSTLGLMQDVLFGKEVTMRLMTNLLLWVSENRRFPTPVFKEQVLHRDDLFPEDYKTVDGDTRYIDDQSDQDATQLVAKKQLASHVSDVGNRYLPYAYQKPLSATYQVRILDSARIPLVNAGFETSQAGNTYTDTTVSAFPGFRYAVQSKGSVSEVGVSSLRKTGRQSAYLKLTGSKAFLEQEVEALPSGDYQYTVAVRTTSATAADISVYSAGGTKIAASEPVVGTTDWHTVSLLFTLETPGSVYLRAGSSEQTANGTLYFDDFELQSQGVIRMNEAGSGEEPLYAYAIRARGQNQLILGDFQSNFNVIHSEHVLTPTIQIRSFVYEWSSERQQFKKVYGKENAVKVSVSNREGEKVVGKLLHHLPGKESGFQWRYDENVFYELSVDSLDSQSAYINLSLYDPSTQTYFYSPSGDWILNREDIWWNGHDSTVQLRISSVADALQVAGQKYSLVYPNDQRLSVMKPNTVDERDRWYARINKGNFTRSYVASKDAREVKEAGRPEFYTEFLSGNHRYSLPEYERQSFYPKAGQRFVQQEVSRYLNRNTITVSKSPMIVKERNVYYAPLVNPSGDEKTFQSLDLFWNSTYQPAIYVQGERVLTGYEIDFEQATVTFKTSQLGTVFADYVQDNLRVFKRKLTNNRIQKERLVRIDDTTMQLSRMDIAVHPHPVFYRENSAIHPGEYWIDYDSGLLNFYESNRKNIYADYSFYVKEELETVDINRFTGEIKLKNPIHFRDEIVVDYLYQEDALEYKGYQDEESGVFQHLDLNPTAGHTYTARKYDKSNTFLYFQEESSEKLLGKEVFIYLVPTFSKYIDRISTEDNVARHCFGESEWRKVKASQPEALLIGRIQVRENTNIENAIVMDARRLGGGLKEHWTQPEIEKRVGYTSAFWDIGGFDGLAYYQNGVTVVRIPERILKSNGGTHTENEIQEILSKYLAFGVYPIIEFTSEEEGS